MSATDKQPVGEEVDWVDANVGLAPTAFYDPITGGVLMDPVIAEDGQCYSRSAIEDMFRQDREMNRPHTSPLTGLPMGTTLNPNTAILEELESFRATHSQEPPPRPLSDRDQEETEGSCDLAGESAAVQSLRDLRQIFSRLDRLRDILATTLEGWQPPQLVVLGGESSGKSTLLARLTMMPLFPAHDQLCTRLPIHVRLRHCSVVRPPRLEVRDAHSGALLEGPWEVPMGSGARSILAKMEELVWSEENQRLGVHTGRMLVVHVESPAVPSLDLVDLPGLVQSPPEMAAATDKLVRRYIQMHDVHSIFLVTVPAVHKPNDSKALALAHQLGVEGRTIGVLTMCDELPKRRHAQLRERVEAPPPNCSEQEMMEWLQEPLPGDAVRLRNGYVATANEPLAVGEDGQEGPLENHYAILNEQAHNELSWFQESGLGDLVEGGRATCNELVGRINTLFVAYIRETWVPVTIFKLNQERQQLCFLDACLGLPEAGERQMGSPETVNRIRDRAVEMAAGSLSAALPEMMQAFGAMLAGLKAKLVQMVPAQQEIMPEELEAKWFTLSDAVMAACAAACEEQEAFWEHAVRTALSTRQQQPAWPSEEGAIAVEGQTFFQLSRFPQFIEAIMQRLRAVLKGEQRESIEAALDAFLGRFFDELLPHPGVTIRPNLSATPATVNVQCNTDMLADTVLLVFLRHGLAMVQQGLMPALAEVASGVADWREACSGERDALKVRLRDVEHSIHAVRQLASSTMASATCSSSMNGTTPERNGGFDGNEDAALLHMQDLLEVSMAHSCAEGLCLESRSLVVGQEGDGTVYITARSATGAPLTGGHLPFKVSLYLCDEGEGAESEEPMVTATAEYMDMGVYKALVTVPPDAPLGLHRKDVAASMTIELFNSAVAGSPFSVTLTAASAASCETRGLGLSLAEPGESSEVDIVARGSVGGHSVLPHQDLAFTVSITRPDSEPVKFESSVECTGDGRYKAKYTIDKDSRSETVTLAVKLHGRHVAGSPFAVRVKLKPLYIMPGVVHGFPVSQLSEWALVYDEPYNHATMTSAFPSFGEWLFICATLEGSDTVTLGAFGEREDIMQDHTKSDSIAHQHHGAFWYWRPNRSVGFASRQQISLNHADTCDEAAEDRLSWHLQQSGNGGWRVGDIKGLEKNCGAWRKQIYVWPASAATPSN